MAKKLKAQKRKALAKKQVAKKVIQKKATSKETPFVQIYFYRATFEMNGVVYESEAPSLDEAMMTFKIPQQLIKTKAVLSLYYDGKTASQQIVGRQIRLFMLNHLTRKIKGKKLETLLK